MIHKNFHIVTVNDIYKMFNETSLIVDSTYQRRKVWNDSDRIRLIETILIGYVIPSLYFWDAETNPTTGKTITHIVDGQQRVSALIDYIEGKYALQKSSLTQPELSGSYANKKFDELSDQAKIIIWSYSIPVVKLTEVEDRETIKKLFNRLNLTDYNLRAQEKRHSTTSGIFTDLAIEISENDFWSDYNLFNSGDIKRMKDVEFCASLLLLAREGIINQTTQKPLNNAYDDYMNEYPDAEEDKIRILNWIEMIKMFINERTSGFIQKKSQLYSMFTVIDYFERNRIEIKEEYINNFNKYVEKYIEFKNGDEVNGESIASIINSHKLAASEGIHKLKNRKIRFEILKNAIVKGIE
ncbi:DUF262 domain-containing protein [Fusibacter bizertensis]